MSPSDEIVRAGTPFTTFERDEMSEDPTAPGDGVPKQASIVALTDVDLNRLADEFSSEIKYQQAAQKPFFQDLIKWDNIYRGKPLQQTKNYPLAHASNVVVKLASIYSNQVIARIFQGITQPQPQWIVTELNKKAAEVCKPYERFLDWSQQNMWHQRKFLLPYVQDCVTRGTAIGYIDYVNDPVVRYNDQQQATEILGYRRGPKPTWVPREDFLQPIGFASIQEAPWMAHRVWFTWDRLEQLSYQGVIENLSELWGHDDEEDQVKSERRKYQDQILQNQAADSRFGLWSPYWVWFRRDLDRDGCPEEYVMLLHVETNTILRLVANPSPSGMRPYVKSAFISVQGEFDGIGIPEDVEQLQDEVSTIHNQRRDRAHLANIVMYIAKMAAQLPDTIRPASGKVIKTPGGAEDIREFAPAIGQVPIDMAEEDMVMRLAAMTVGMNDVDLGKVSSPVGRAAATSIMAIMQEGARRFDLNVTQIREALTEESHIVTELWQVYGLPAPEETGSPELVLDEQEAQLVRALLEQPASLRGLINIQLNASTAAVNREVEKQSNIQLYGIVQQYLQQVLQMATVIANPMVPPEMKAVIVHGVQGQDTLLRKLFQSYDAFDLEGVLAEEIIAELFQRSQQQVQQLQQAGIDPQAQLMAQQMGGGASPQGQPQKPPNGSAQ